MTNEDRKAIYTALGAILASLRQIEMKIQAAEKVLERFPPIHADYQRELGLEKARTENDLSTTLEYLRRTLLTNME